MIRIRADLARRPDLCWHRVEVFGQCAYTGRIVVPHVLVCKFEPGRVGSQLCERDRLIPRDEIVVDVLADRQARVEVFTRTRRAIAVQTMGLETEPSRNGVSASTGLPVSRSATPYPSASVVVPFLTTATDAPGRSCSSRLSMTSSSTCVSISSGICSVGCVASPSGSENPPAAVPDTLVPAASAQLPARNPRRVTLLVATPSCCACI